MPNDQLWRFHFVRSPVRGMWVRLNHVLRDASHARSYDTPAKRVLGEMLATVALIANNIKHEGGLTLHAVGDGPIKTAFAECQGQHALRGIVRMNEDEPHSTHTEMTFKDLMGSGRMAITMQFESGESYQGLVDMSYESLGESMESYFESSEQLDTTFSFGTDDDAVTCCFLQRLPSAAQASDLTLAYDEAEWWRLVNLFRTIRPAELRSKDIRSMLSDVFPNDTIQLNEPRHLRFECTCNRERCTNALQTFPPDELQEMVRENGGIQVTCEFCGCQYEFLETEFL
ncbi:MAG: Hsp33 family molecular chaperone HslO [Gammaproteobacteria bacterium]|nr:Hsp33 family molecular chaperone HslO [Gammaproteobacteria bacterium]